MNHWIQACEIWFGDVINILTEFVCMLLQVNSYKHADGVKF